MKDNRGQQIGGLKSQNGFLRGKIKSLEELRDETLRRLDKMQLQQTLLVVSNSIFYAIFILGLLVRHYG